MSTDAPCVWITGASSGIGQALAEAYAANGRPVVATARRGEALEALRMRWPTIESLVADTTDRQSMADLRLYWEQQPLSLAILNAGTCEYLDVRQFDADLVERVITTNVVGTARSVEAALPGLRLARSRGLPARLAIVSSSAWWFPFPRAEAYSASKAALTSFAHSLRADLAGEGIGVSVISPGFVKTPLTDRNDFAMPFRISAEEAATIIVRSLDRGRDEIAFPRRFTWLLRSLGILPRPLIDRLAARLSRNSQEAATP